MHITFSLPHDIFIKFSLVFQEYRVHSFFHHTFINILVAFSALDFHHIITQVFGDFQGCKQFSCNSMYISFCFYIILFCMALNPGSGPFIGNLWGLTAIYALNYWRKYLTTAMWLLFFCERELQENKIKLPFDLLISVDEMSC